MAVIRALLADPAAAPTAVPLLDRAELAAALLAGVQGGVLILLTTGSAVHLEAALDSGLARLREARPLS